MNSTNHPLFARLYTRAGSLMERGGGADHRRRLVSGLTGRVIEVGAGNGLNFAHYPAGVRAVVAVEPEPYMREAAGRSARAVEVPIEVIDGTAERLPVPDEGFDAAVVSLVLCSVADQRLALGELHRVLRPGGELRFFEHVRAETPGLRRAQRLVDATLWPALFGGCHTGRDTLAEITAAGFRIVRLERFAFPAGPVMPASPHVLGIARKACAQSELSPPKRHSS